MALFRFRWLRRFVRKNTTPIPHKIAANWERRLGLAYAFIAWNTLGYIGELLLQTNHKFCDIFIRIESTAYQYYKGENTKPVSEMERNMTPSQRFALGAGIEKAKVLQVRGFTKIGELDFDANEYKKEVEPVVEIEDEFDWNTQQNIQIDEANMK